MTNSRRAIVDVFPASAMAERPRLFAALRAAFAVTFRPHAEGVENADGLIAFGADVWSQSKIEQYGAPVLRIGDCTVGVGDREEVRLLDPAALDRRLHGIVLHDTFPTPFEPIDGDETVLAVAESGPAWTMSTGRAPVHRVRSLLPELESDRVLWSMLSRRPIALIALVQFLRSVAGSTGWQPPPLRATFMFDDPNLHWRSYGFIDYRRLLAHADEHGYHTAIAMIPIDARWTHRPTAALFARRTDRLSLVIHGNDHVKEELRALREPREAIAAAAQASRRISRFERSCGVNVDRVMTPPHGLCAREMTEAVGAVGFEALCTGKPLPWTSRLPADKLLAAWRPAEFAGGCVVIPRMPMHSSPASVALRAFLDHPLVIYGHHQDLADGLERLAAVAGFVNRLGSVSWQSVGRIASSNGALRILDGQATLRPYARQIALTVADGVESISVEAPQDLLGGEHFTGWSLAHGPLIPFGEPIPTRGANQLTIQLRRRHVVDPAQIAAPRWRPWPRLRRTAAEARDRTLPSGASRLFAR